MGLSSLLDGGHVVHVPGSETKKEHFLHTFHARARLHDPGPPKDHLEVVEPPKPRRRIATKTPEGHVEMKTLNLSQEEMDQYANAKARLIMDDWSMDSARALVGELAEGFYAERKFGVYRHGGSVGWMKSLPEYPELGRMMAKMVLESFPEATSTSIMVSKDFNRGYHKDSNNDANTRNYVIPIQVPSQGGALWVELQPGDVVEGEVLQRLDPHGKVHYGQVYEMKEGTPIVLDPRCAHEVLPWTGTRIYEDIKNLEDCGFPTPLSQLPEYFVSDKTTEKCLNRVDAQEDTMEADGEEDGLSDEDWEMFVEAERGHVKIGASTAGRLAQLQPHIGKTEVVYTKDVEKILSELKEPLKVTYTVDPKEALQHLPVWKEAIAKEVKGVSVAIRRLMPGTPERVAWIHKRGAQRLPTKLVYTIKPNDVADPLDRSTWFRRKVRLVVRGNMANSSFSDYYCGAAPIKDEGLAGGPHRCGGSLYPHADWRLGEGPSDHSKPSKGSGAPINDYSPRVVGISQSPLWPQGGPNALVSL